MPHLTLQYTNNLKIENGNTVLNELNEFLWESGQFSNANELKSRILSLSDFLVGTNTQLPKNQEDEGFIYLHLKLMAGRSNDVKQHFAKNLAEIVKQTVKFDVSMNIQVCVEIEDIASCYHNVSI